MTVYILSRLTIHNRVEYDKYQNQFNELRVRYLLSSLQKKQRLRGCSLTIMWEFQGIVTPAALWARF